MILTRVISGFLALLMLLGNAGISLHGHYCKDQLRKLTVFVSPESCHQAQEACHNATHAPKVRSCCKLPSAASSAPKVEVPKDDCCSNKAQVLHLENETDSAPAFLTLEHVVAPMALPQAPVVSLKPQLDERLSRLSSHRWPPGGRTALQLFSIIRC